MNWNEILKPTWQKALLTLAIFLPVALWVLLVALCYNCISDPPRANPDVTLPLILAFAASYALACAVGKLIDLRALFLPTRAKLFAFAVLFAVFVPFVQLSRSRLSYFDTSILACLLELLFARRDYFAVVGINAANAIIGALALCPISCAIGSVDWKKLLRPSKEKLLLALAIFIILIPLFARYTEVQCFTAPCPPIHQGDATLLGMLLGSLDGNYSYRLLSYAPENAIFGAFCCYFAACALMHAWQARAKIGARKAASARQQGF